MHPSDKEKIKKPYRLRRHEWLTYRHIEDFIKQDVLDRNRNLSRIAKTAGISRMVLVSHSDKPDVMFTLRSGRKLEVALMQMGYKPPADVLAENDK